MWLEFALFKNIRIELRVMALDNLINFYQCVTDAILGTCVVNVYKWGLYKSVWDVVQQCA